MTTGQSHVHLARTHRGAAQRLDAALGHIGLQTWQFHPRLWTPERALRELQAGEPQWGRATPGEHGNAQPRGGPVRCGGWPHPWSGPSRERSGHGGLLGPQRPGRIDRAESRERAWNWGLA